MRTITALPFLVAALTACRADPRSLNLIND